MIPFKRFIILTIFITTGLFIGVSFGQTIPSSVVIDPAGIGVERVARLFTPVYQSRFALTEDTIRWIQIDLGQPQRIDAVKLYPRVLPWNYTQSEGFPSHFKIEVSNEPDFKNSVILETRERIGYPDPGDMVCTFESKEVTGREIRGRYVRLTATKLRQKHLALTKMSVLSGDKDIAEGCPVSDSESGSPGVSVLTRPPRPQGEGVYTNNPGNVIPAENWKPVKYKAQVPLGGVELGDGIFKTVMENNIGYLLSSFTVDEMVRNFKMKAGKPVTPINEKLNNFWWVDLPGSEAGRFLMGSGNALRWMENTELRKRMNQIVDVIDECKEADGYIMAYPKNMIYSGEYGAYVRSWVTHGLIEAGYAGNKKAFPLLRGFYDWFDSCRYLPELLRRPGQGVQGIVSITRMYFTPVGKPKDIQVVQQYFQENYWMDDLAKREKTAIWKYPYDRPHCYLITAIEPYLDLHTATGVRKYLDAALGGWDLYHDNWIHVGGSIAICEGTDLYPPKSYFLHRSTGELCGSVFWIKLNQRFHLLNPEDEKYVTEIEKSIYNVAIANQIGTKGIRYFNVLVDHKDTDHFPYSHCMNTCCEGQGTRLFGSLPEYIYSITDDGIYVNLFVDSKIKFKLQNDSMQINQDTKFPFDKQVQLTVAISKPLQAKIRIRIPSWAAKEMSVLVNGKIAVTGKPGNYVTLARVWKNADIVSFELPVGFRISRYEGAEEKYNDGKHFALEYGPILMAATRVSNSQNEIRINAQPEKLVKNMKPIPGQQLSFTINNNNDIQYRPYFELQEEPFSCYPAISDK
jgi:DUF1680 family protein